MCEFCENFDFGQVGIDDILGTEKVCLANGSYKFPIDKQFAFCPKCGRPLTKGFNQDISIRATRDEICRTLNYKDIFDAHHDISLDDTFIVEFRGKPFVLNICKPNQGEYTTPINYLKYLAEIKDAAK